MTPWTVAHQAPLSMGFPKQEYLSGLPFPPSGAPRDQGIEPESPTLAGGLFTTEPPGKSIYSVRLLRIFLVELSAIFPCNKCIFFLFFILPVSENSRKTYDLTLINFLLKSVTKESLTKKFLTIL